MILQSACCVQIKTNFHLNWKLSSYQQNEAMTKQSSRSLHEGIIHPQCDGIILTTAETEYFVAFAVWTSSRASFDGFDKKNRDVTAINSQEFSRKAEDWLPGVAAGWIAPLITLYEWKLELYQYLRTEKAHRSKVDIEIVHTFYDCRNRTQMACKDRYIVRGRQALPALKETKVRSTVIRSDICVGHGKPWAWKKPVPVTLPFFVLRLSEIEYQICSCLWSLWNS